jgi:N-acetylmuramoyl-L-alanine amidase
MSTKPVPTLILDPGHGMANRAAGRFDPGIVHANHREVDIVMEWANEIRAICIAAGLRVIRTRIDHRDPAPIGQRAAIARRFHGHLMLSIHTNAAGPTANGTETFYRGAQNLATATAINRIACEKMGTRNRGAKLEAASQHARLAVMAFQPTFLLELGFLTNPGDREKMLDPQIRRATSQALADFLIPHIRKIAG